MTSNYCLSQAVDLYQQSVNILNSVYNSAKEFCQSKSDHEVHSNYHSRLPPVYIAAVSFQEVVLPVQRVLVKASLDLTELLVDVFSEHTCCLRLERDKQQQKSSVEKVWSFGRQLWYIRPIIILCVSVD